MCGTHPFFGGTLSLFSIKFLSLKSYCDPNRIGSGWWYNHTNPVGFVRPQQLVLCLFAYFSHGTVYGHFLRFVLTLTADL
jgi:hypothetical protein